jgi:hypothetical protein
MFKTELETIEYNWGKSNIEQLIETENILINNINCFLPTSTFSLEKGKYNLFINKENKNIFIPEIKVYKFIGKLKLTGSEKENKMLAELEGEDFKKFYILKSTKNELQILITEKLIKELNIDLNEKIYINLIKNEI